MNFKTSRIAIFQLLSFAILFFSVSAQSFACDRSHLQVDQIVDLGSGKYRIEMTMCTGGGKEGGVYGADQNTGNFAFEVQGANVTAFQPIVTSPQTGAGYVGFFPTSSQTLVGYQNADDWFACINDECGGLQTVCAKVYLETQGMPTKIILKGMEGADVLNGGCTGAQMEVSPGSCGVFSVNAGPDVEITKNKCATLTAASSGAGTITYLWSDGQSTASVQVCPNATTLYTVTATSTNGCVATSDVTVSVKGGGKPAKGGGKVSAKLTGHGKSKK